MNKKLQVFVSSTYTDLIEERQAAEQAIWDAGHIPAGMELFKAGKSQMKTIRKWIDESDVYMLILGGRYGSIEEESGLSYTELEYRYALSKNMPVFAIILEDSFLHIKASSSNTDNIFEKKNKSKYSSFKKYVKMNIVRFAGNIDQISSNIHAQLNDILSNDEYKLIGWIRGNVELSDNHSKILQEFIKLLEDVHSATYEFVYIKNAEKFNELLVNLYHHISALYKFNINNSFELNDYKNSLSIIFTNYENIYSKIQQIVKAKNNITDENDRQYFSHCLTTLYNEVVKLLYQCKSDLYDR